MLLLGKVWGGLRFRRVRLGSFLSSLSRCVDSEMAQFQNLLECFAACSGAAVHEQVAFGVCSLFPIGYPGRDHQGVCEVAEPSWRLYKGILRDTSNCAIYCVKAKKKKHCFWLSIVCAWAHTAKGKYKANQYSACSSPVRLQTGRRTGKQDTTRWR